MVRGIKYDDSVYEKTEFTGKIFMYNSLTWNTLFPVVDVIRLLKKNTVITHVYGKNQNQIRLYGMQYGHRVYGVDLKNKNNYFENFKNVRCVFIYSDTADDLASNIIQFAETAKIPLVCYSTLDSLYHFYHEGKESLRSADSVVEKMYTLFDISLAKKFDDLFPDFKILTKEPQSGPSTTTLEECVKKLNISTKLELEKREKFQIKKYKEVSEKPEKVEKTNAFKNFFKTN
jgi:hypothetical protein